MKKPLRVMLTGGLGNQLFQLAAALYFAENRPVELVDSIGRPRTNSFGLPDIDTFVLPLDVLIIKSDKYSMLISKTSGFMLRKGMNPHWYEKNKLFEFLTQLLSSILLSIYLKDKVALSASNNVGYSDDIKASGSKFLVGYFQSYKWLENTEVLKKMHNMSPKNKDDSNFLNWIKLAKSEKPIILHLRLGDYRNENSFGIPNPDYYKRSLDYILKLNSNNKVWIFSDETDSALDFLPQEYLDHYKLIDTRNLDSAQTLEIMKYGISYVIGNSTFSWWAATLSKTNSPIVVAPCPWFKSLEEPESLIPNNWIRVSAWE